MAEYIVAGLIVALAVFGTVRAVYRSATGKGGCDCGLNDLSCPGRNNCADGNGRQGTENGGQEE